MAYQTTFQAEVWRMIRNALSAADSVYDNRVYFVVAPRDSTYPILVYQSQDLGGINYDTINANGWRGLVTLRSIATDIDTAQTKLAQALQAIGMSVTVSGITTSGLFNMSMKPVYPLLLPIERLTETDLLYTVAVVTEIVIMPNT